MATTDDVYNLLNTLFDGSRPDVKLGQLSCVCAKPDEGALHLVNTDDDGNGLQAVGKVAGVYAYGNDATTGYGMKCYGTSGGMIIAAAVSSYGLTITGIAGTIDTATLAAAADSLCDEALSSHTTPGTLGKALSDILDDTGTSGVVVKAASTVGAFPTGALVNAPTGSTITVSQTAAVGSIQAFNLETTQYGSPSLPITCSVSQQGDSHKFALYPLDDYSAPTVTLGSSLCSVGASPYTTVTVALDDAYTTSAGVFSYILRNVTDDVDAARGSLRIRPASNLTST